jgi:stage II sporulation protein D
VERIIRDFTGEPVLKVNVVNYLEFADIRCTGNFDILDGDKLILKDVCSDLKWRIKLDSSEPAQYVYTLQIGVVKDRAEAEKLSDELKILGFEARIQELGGMVRLNGKVITDNTHYRVLTGEFNSEPDTVGHCWKLFDEFDAEVIKEKIREARGTIEIFDEEYEKSAKIENEIKLIPSDAHTEIIIYDRINNNGDEESDIIEKHYSWPMVFKVGDNGGLTAIGEIPLETYLKGVLPSEMKPDYPMEALKCQAIVSRTFALSNIGLSHPDSAFDICSDNHCQLFNGSSRYHENTSHAVEETAGKVLFMKRILCETPYTALCGGYTSGQHLFWVKDKKCSDKVVYDGPGKSANAKPLNGESKVIDWVISQPDVYCNPEGSTGSVPVEYKSGFRWEMSISRKRLEDIVGEKTGEDIGTIYDIIPLKRNGSGRLQEIEILGSRKNLKVRRERNIRRTLSERQLKSSCFVIEKEVGDDGIPLTFTFTGAGMGHGAGMCQAGAVAMAIDGKACEAILNHYYREAGLKKLY